MHDYRKFEVGVSGRECRTARLLINALWRGLNGGAANNGLVTFVPLARYVSETVSDNSFKRQQ